MEELEAHYRALLDELPTEEEQNFTLSGETCPPPPAELQTGVSSFAESLKVTDTATPFAAR